MDITSLEFSADHGWVDHHRLPTKGHNPILHLFLCEEQAAPLRPKIGLSESADYQACYLSSQERQPASFVLVPGPVGDGRCGFWEIDRNLMPGLYGLQIPLYMRTQGYSYIYLCFTGARPQYLEIQCVDFDPYDSIALGLTTWIRSTCHEHLTSGLRKSMPATLQPLLLDWFNQNP